MLTLSILALNLSNLSVYAQERASNSDLRGGVVLFSIDYQKKGYSLIRSSAGDHQLITRMGKKENHEKMNSSVATTLDDEISAEFINLKYFMGDIKKCSKGSYFSMRGEEFEVCPKDKRRLLKVSELVKLIESKK